MTPPPITAAQLTARREALELSQAELSRALGVSEATISRWERGERTIRTPVMLDMALQTLEREHLEHSDDPLPRLPRPQSPRSFEKASW
ncbi:MAG: helix-turn-helix domain-containing protein [Dehalococcoidia bacterium]